MKCFDTLELLSPDATYYEHEVDEHCSLGFKELIEASRSEAMRPLSVEAIDKHLIGQAILGTSRSARGLAQRDVLAYAGITGLEVRGDTKLAVVGSVITHPETRNIGLGFLAVRGLLGRASAPKYKSEFGHQGYMAKCNETSMKLFEKLGFVTAGLSEGKELMVKVH